MQGKAPVHCRVRPCRGRTAVQAKNQLVSPAVKDPRSPSCHGGETTACAAQQSTTGREKGRLLRLKRPHGCGHSERPGGLAGLTPDHGHVRRQWGRNKPRCWSGLQAQRGNSRGRSGCQINDAGALLGIPSNSARVGARDAPPNAGPADAWGHQPPSRSSVGGPLKQRWRPCDCRSSAELSLAAHRAWVAAILLGQRHSRLLREGVKSARTGAPASGITWSVPVAVSLSEHAVPGRGEDETGPRDDKESGGPWVTPGAVQSVGAKVGIFRCKKFAGKRGRGRLAAVRSASSNNQPWQRRCEHRWPGGSRLLGLPSTVHA